MEVARSSLATIAILCHFHTRNVQYDDEVVTVSCFPLHLGESANADCNQEPGTARVRGKTSG